jgi:hypothetical protein
VAGDQSNDPSNKVNTPEVAAIVGSQRIGAWLSPDDRLVSIPGSNLTSCAICHRSGQRGDHAVPQECPTALGTAFAQPPPLEGLHPRYMTPSHTFTVQGRPPHLMQMSHHEKRRGDEDPLRRPSSAVRGFSRRLPMAPTRDMKDEGGRRWPRLGFHPAHPAWELRLA